MDNESNKLENYEVPISDDLFHRGDSFRADSSHADSYTEIVEEMETVSQELQKTRQRLWEAQDKLKVSHVRIQELEDRLSTSQADVANIRILEDEKRALVHEEEKLYDENAMLRDQNNFLQGSERQLKKAVEILQRDISASRERCRESDTNVKFLKEEVAKLESRLKSNGSDVNDTKAQLRTSEQHLCEAREETAKLVEEVASIRDELRTAKAAASEKEEAILEKVIKQYKERLTLEVRNKVTQQVTLKVSREVRAEMKEEREKEFSSLREQIKKIVKENAMLQEQARKANAAAAENRDLEDEVPRLQYEISRLVSELENTKKEQESAVAELETFFRIKVQAIREETTKEKWATITELRQQVAKDRAREAVDFGNRLDSLTRETDRLLAEAAKDKEAHVAKVRQKLAEDKQREINLLKGKLEVTIKAKEVALEKAEASKEELVAKIRKESSEEAQLELTKYRQRIETLERENEALEKRVDSYEDDLNWSLRENEGTADQLKTSQDELKAMEDELYKVKRKNQNLTTLVDRYKADNAEMTNELKQVTLMFREALVKSEQKSLILEDKVKSLELSMNDADKDSSEVFNELEKVKESHVRSEKEILSLKVEKQKLTSMLESKQQSQGQKDAFEAEKSELKDKIESLESLVEKYKTEFLEVSEELDTSTTRFKGALMASENEIVLLKEKIKDMNVMIEANDGQRLAPKDGEKHKQATEARLTEEIKVDTGDLSLKEDIRNFNIFLEKNEGLGLGVDEVSNHVTDIRKMLDKLLIEHGASSQSPELSEHALSKIDVNADEGFTMIKDRISRIGGALKTYKQEVEEASKKLEQFRIGFNEEYLSSYPEDVQMNEKGISQHSTFSAYKRKLLESSQELESTKQQLRDASLAAQKEMTVLKRTIQDLESKVVVLESDQAIYVHDVNTSANLRNALIESQSEVAQLKENAEKLKTSLELADRKHGETSKELLHTKNSFSEDVEKSEEKVSKLLARIQTLESSLEASKCNYLALSRELEISKRHRVEDSNTSISKLSDKIQNLEALLQKNKSRQSETSILLRNSRPNLQGALSAAEGEALDQQSTINNLQLQLEESKQENLKISNELQHSMKLFNDALVAWREETKAQQACKPSTKQVESAVQMTKQCQNDAITSENSLADQAENDFNLLERKVYEDEGSNFVSDSENFEGDFPFPDSGEKSDCKRTTNVDTIARKSAPQNLHDGKAKPAGSSHTQKHNNELSKTQGSDMKRTGLVENRETTTNTNAMLDPRKKCGTALHVESKSLIRDQLSSAGDSCALTREHVGKKTTKEQNQSVERHRATFQQQIGEWDNIEGNSLGISDDDTTVTTASTDNNDHYPERSDESEGDKDSLQSCGGRQRLDASKRESREQFIHNSAGSERKKRVSWVDSLQFVEELSDNHLRDGLVEGTGGDRSGKEAPRHIGFKRPETLVVHHKGLGLKETSQNLEVASHEDDKMVSDVDALSESSTLDETVSSNQNPVTVNVEQGKSQTGLVQKSVHPHGTGFEAASAKKEESLEQFQSSHSGRSADSESSFTRRMMLNWKAAVDDFSAILQEDGDSWSASRSILEFSSGASSEDLVSATKNMVASSLERPKSSSSVRKKTVTFKVTGGQVGARETKRNTFEVNRPMSPETSDKDENSQSGCSSLESSLKGENLTMLLDEEESIDWILSQNLDYDTEIDVQDAGKRALDTFGINKRDEALGYNYLSPDSSTHEAMDVSPSKFDHRSKGRGNGVCTDGTLRYPAIFSPPAVRSSAEESGANDVDEHTEELACLLEPEYEPEWPYKGTPGSSDAREDATANNVKRNTEEIREQAPITSDDLSLDMSTSFDSDSRGSSDRQSQADSETLESTAESVLLGIDFDGMLQDSDRSSRGLPDGKHNGSSSKLRAQTTFFGGFGDESINSGEPQYSVCGDDSDIHPHDSMGIVIDDDSLDAVAEEVLLGASPSNVLQKRLYSPSETTRSRSLRSQSIVEDASESASVKAVVTRGSHSPKFDGPQHTWEETTGPTSPLDGTRAESGIQMSLQHSRLSARKATQIRRFFSKKPYNRFDTAKPETADGKQPNQGKVEAKLSPQRAPPEDDFSLDDNGGPSWISDDADITLPSVPSE